MIFGEATARVVEGVRRIRRICVAFASIQIS